MSIIFCFAWTVFSHKLIQMWKYMKLQAIYYFSNKYQFLYSCNSACGCLLEGSVDISSYMASCFITEWVNYGSLNKFWLVRIIIWWLKILLVRIAFFPQQWSKGSKIPYDNFSLIFLYLVKWFPDIWIFRYRYIFRYMN